MSDALNPKQFFTHFSSISESLFSALDKHKSKCGYPVYSSMDVRDAGWKLAAVDVNLFPAGWNNLTVRDADRASVKLREFFLSKLGIQKADSQVITLVPEAHTQNAGYLENLSGILDLLKSAGFTPKLLWPGTPLPKPWMVTTASGKKLEYLPKEDALKNSIALFLNHDLSGGIPDSIKNVALPTFPNPRLGWYRRKKSNHQDITHFILRSLSEKIDGFDPFYFIAKSKRIENVDFNSEESVESIFEIAKEFLAHLSEEYRYHKIESLPQMFIKNNAGTYGMGVLSVKNIEEIKSLSSKTKSKMKLGKGSVPITEVILQETIPTCLVYQDASDSRMIASEPVIYLVDGCPVGGFLRTHENLGENAATENLNQPGSKLEPLECPDFEGRPTRPFPKPRGLNSCQQLGPLQVYSFLAKLHSIAAGLEDCPE